MYTMFKKLWNDKRGNSLIIAAAALPLVMGSAGLAVDTIQWALWKRQLQRAADSAAIAAVYDRINGGDEDSASTAVDKDLTLNNHTRADLVAGYPALEFPEDDGDMQDQVKVSLAVQRPLSFSGMFMQNPPLIVANATAAAVPGTGEFCVVSLETSGSKTGITVSGNAGIEMDCSFMTNSPSNEAAVAKGSSEVSAVSVSAVGGITKSSNWDIESYNPYSSALEDPFKDVNPTAAEMKCAGTWTTKGKNKIWNASALTESTDLNNSHASDGTTKANCFSSLSVSPNTTLNLPANSTIYINAGDINVQGTLNCSGCTLILTNESTSTTATIGNLKVNATAAINITAPTSGKYQGIAIYQDRRAQDKNSANNKINGNSGSIVQGALYFPSQELDYNGTGTTEAICTMFVSRRIIFSGNNTTSNKFKKGSECGAYGLPTVEGEASQRVRLVA